MMNANLIHTIALVIVLATVCLTECTHQVGAIQRDRGQDRELRDECVAETAQYVSQAAIEGPVRTLVGKSREFYPNIMELIDDELPSSDYIQALASLGTQTGCDTLQDHLERIEDEVGCYALAGLDTDPNGTRDVAKASQRARDVFEAYFACQNAERKVRVISGN